MNKIEILNILNRDKILRGESAGDVAIQCPFCRAVTATGEKYLTMIINSDTVRSYCGECRKSVSFDELLEVLEIKTSPTLSKSEAGLQLSKTELSIGTEEYESNRFVPENHRNLVASGIMEIEWLVENIVAVEGYTLISGAQQSGKSLIALLLANTVTTGNPLFGKFVAKKGRVLFVDEENGRTRLAARTNLLGIPAECEIEYLINKSIMVDSLKDLTRLVALCQKKKYSLIIFDSLVRFFRGNENEAGVMSEVNRCFNALRATGAAIVALAHNKKSGFDGASELGSMVRGSSEIVAAPDCHIALKKIKNVIEVRQPKFRDGDPFHPFKLNIIGDKTFIKITYDGQLDEEKSKKEETADAVVSLLQEGELPRDVIVEKLKDIAGEGVIGKVLTELLKTKAIQRRSGDNNKHFYSLMEESADEQV